MLHDILLRDGGKFEYASTNAKGEHVVTNVSLDESDPLWLQVAPPSPSASP